MRLPLRRCALVLGPVVAMTVGGMMLQAQPAPSPGGARVRTAAPAGAPRPGPGNGAPNNAPPGNGAPPNPGAAQAPTTQPVQVFMPSSQPTTRPSKISLNFKDATLDTVLDYLSQAAGFVIIKEGQVEGRITVVSKQPVTPEEAVNILNASLKANNFVAVGSGRELRVLPREKAKKGNVPVHFGADPKAIPDTDEIVTQVIPVQNVDAAKLREELKPLMPQDADAVTADEASNSIVITDSSSNIRHVVEIISALDQHEATTSDIRIVQLKWANAAQTVKLIQAIFKGEAAGPQQPQPGMPMPQPQPGGGGARHGRIPGSGIDKALRGAKINAAADDRTNTIVITGPTETLKVIDDILAKLDANQQAATELRAFPLKYADAEAISKLIVSTFKGDDNRNREDDYFFYRPFRQSEDNQKVKMNVSFDQRTNTVIVTAPPDILKAIEGLLEKLDANPGGASDIRVYPLQYADAYSVSKLITSTFNPDDGSTRRFVPFFIFGDGPANQQKGPKVSATSDDRTNTLVVTAPTEMFATIEKIVHQLDTNPVAEDSVFIYRLKNGQASNLELVLNTLFGNVQGNQGQQQNQNGPQGFNQPFGGQNQNNGPGRGGRGPGNSSFGNNRNNNNNGPGNRNNNNRRNAQSQLSPGALQAVNMLTGEAFVVADTDTNSLIVTTATKYKEQVRQIIDELDRPVPQVLIKVLIAEVTHDNSADFGTDFSILNTRSNALGQSFGQSFGAPGSGLVATLVENKINVQLHALAVAGKLDVLSRPYILASDNQLSSILVGSSVPFITNSQITELGQTINTIEYDDIGITLDVTPHINPDGLVIMDVAPGISQLTDQSVPITSNVSAPVIAKRSAQSRVGVRDGQTVVIGGMMQDNKTSTVNKVPILGDIPILQLLFSRTQVSKTKTELLIFLTPHVAQLPDTLKSMSEDEMKGTRLTPRAVGPGVFDEQRRGLQRGNVPETRPANTPAIREIDQPAATRPAGDDMQVKRNPTEPFSAPLHSQ